MTPKIVNKEAKRTEILHAAIRVFSEKGVAKTKMIDIATAAGVGKGTIYEYFRSKDDVFAGTFTMFFAQMESFFRQAMQASDNPEEQLRKIISASLVDFLEQGGDFINVMMDFWAESIRNKDHELLEALNLKQIYTNYRALISGILESGIRRGIFRPVDSHALASFLIGALDGLMLQQIMEPGIIDLKQMADTICDEFMNGIKK